MLSTEKEDRKLLTQYSALSTQHFFMRLFHGTDNARIARPTVLTLGVFDGLHLGHQLVMRTLTERARATASVPTVITFDPHPRAVLHPESAPPLLQTFDQKVEAFGVLGVEQTIVIRFTREFASCAERSAGARSVSRRRTFVPSTASSRAAEST